MTSNTPPFIQVEIRPGYVEVTHSARIYGYHIPEGVKSNFASIPWFARWLISPIDPTIMIPSVVHDYLVGEDIGGTRQTSHMGWIQADRVLRRLMKDYGAAAWKRNLVYYAVKLHGLFR